MANPSFVLDRQSKLPRGPGDMMGDETLGGDVMSDDVGDEQVAKDVAVDVADGVADADVADEHHTPPAGSTRARGKRKAKRKPSRVMSPRSLDAALGDACEREVDAASGAAPSAAPFRSGG